MAFFAPRLGTSESFAPLFNIINDFDGPTFQSKASSTFPASHPLAAYMAPSWSKCSSESDSQRPMTRALRTFKPKFDVRETADAYELHGELAGLKKKNVSIEFTDAQTLVVRGHVESVYTKASPTESQAKEEVKTIEPDHSDSVLDIDSTDSAAEKTFDSRASTAESTAPQSPKPHKATVEDTTDEDDRFSVTSMSSTHSATPSHTAASATDDSLAKKPSAQSQTEATHKPSESFVAKSKSDKAKYWVQERSVGEFSRTFSFPCLIHQDKVHASLEDGILSVVIPKARHETRRIVIF
ncbi:uncharacterized protein BROUX77_004230 [Berkeleyomyces rouxiae]|uniref:uncharacterized protein n=1 Tax=Berkeleyomyces rouxiae TaxID=2035830 RepID=UPI003B7DDEBE